MFRCKMILCKEQQDTINKIGNIFKIFKKSESNIRPHFLLTGSSGSGKSYTVQHLTNEYDMAFVEVNAAQLTKEGTSGNSLSKVLSPLVNLQDKQTVCFVDEFDKLFISGNTNTQLAHETTNGVQNEFLKLLESDTCSVYGDYGKYININVNNVLFIFAGAFNGETNITSDKLKTYGIKTEFLGRVALSYHMNKLSIDSIEKILIESKLLKEYLKLCEVDKKQAVDEIMCEVVKLFSNNTIGVRIVTLLTHKYFINKLNQ